MPRLDMIDGLVTFIGRRSATTEEGIIVCATCNDMQQRILGGPDAAIVWKLSTMLNASQHYTHIGLLENDVLLDEDWFTPTMALFEKGKQDGLTVGAVSARSYVDRVLIQRDGYAVMHNLGAGMVIFTRDAAQAVLHSFRTHWWPANRILFGQLAGIDLATYAAFKGGEHFVSTDWGFDAQLASRGFASLALTPAKCQMIGQKWPLKDQGLELTTEGNIERADSTESFRKYQASTENIRNGHHCEIPGLIHRQDRGMLFFPHQLGYIPSHTWQGSLELAWNQGFGPFGYRAGPAGASLSLHIAGFCSFHVGGGAVTIEDKHSGFRTSPDLTEVKDQVAVHVPGGPISRQITLELGAGAVLHGLSTSDPQIIDPRFSFDWSQLPEAQL